ncbi:putative polyprotein [Tanacetum coccineum]
MEDMIDNDGQKRGKRQDPPPNPIATYGDRFRKKRKQAVNWKFEGVNDIQFSHKSETRKSLQQISTKIQQSKPLTKREVLNLVQEIAEQPKLVEKEALRLTEDLNQKIQKVEHLLHEE